MSSCGATNANLKRAISAGITGSARFAPSTASASACDRAQGAPRALSASPARTTTVGASTCRSNTAPEMACCRRCAVDSTHLWR